ncbi:MAG: SPOR domain-containing protein [Christensenellaceae bacterium]|nr:SPOR domain-containing protein [Christensenellaceae bacterium]
MRRMERRMYRIKRGQAFARRILLGAAAIVALTGLIGRLRGGNMLSAQLLSEPTATPIASGFDETVETREITLPAEVWYAIQTGVFSTREAAEEKAGVYADRGAPGYVTQDGDKWRVFIACYGDKTDANNVRTRLGDAQQVETYLFEWACPQVRLRLSGMVGQMDVVEAGLLLRQQMARQLREDASRLDSGAITAGDERQTLESLDGQVSLWADTARSRFARPYPALVEALLGWSDHWQTRYSALSAATGDPTALSAALKAQAMALFADNISFRNQLNAQ